jgi:drug/metabolite transporter (DMT)-like permease
MFKKPTGQLLAILSASLFGVSPLLCKLLIGNMSPALLAGLLYLGSGIGLEMFLLIKGIDPFFELRRLTPDKRIKLLAAIFSGGIIAPLFLTYGIKYGNAAEVTLLLNLETVATTIISWLVFKEYISLQLWTGKFLILAAAAGIVFQTEDTLSFSLSGSLVVLACIFWGFDNSLTREIDDMSSVNLAGIKGLSAGIFNTSLALLFTSGNASLFQWFGSMAIGALSYGLSLVLFIESLRRIGAARTSTFFMVGPFIGTLLSILILGEIEPPSFWIAISMMFFGVIVLYKEKHGHRHTHEPLFHRHSHDHDDHHQHFHGDDLIADTHEHSHNHDTLTHLHGHWPDTHHRHGHRKGKNNE